MSVSLLISCLNALTAGAFAAMELPKDSATCVRWAAARVERVLGERGIAPAGVGIVVQKDDEKDRVAGSYALAVAGNTVTLSGSDATGRMYGLLELAEQIENAPPGNDWARMLPALVSKTESPFLAFRADNPFIHIDRKGLTRFAELAHLINPPALFEDMAMWKSYIEMLAANRFNVLDLHGGYNLATTSFFNLLPLLVTLPSYPDVGSAKMQQRNLRDLAEITAYAEDRGMSVALMNYSARVDGIAPEKLGTTLARRSAAY